MDKGGWGMWPRRRFFGGAEMRPNAYDWQEETRRPHHEIISFEYPLYDGYSTQEASQAYQNAVDEGINAHWYINGNLYRTSGKPSTVAV